MALTKCPECGHDVSTAATVCPNCGAPIKGASPIRPSSLPPSGPPPPPPPSQPSPRSAAAPSGSKKKWWLLGCGGLALVIGAVLVGVIGTFSFLGSHMAPAKIENMQITGDTRIINGEFDYGEIVAFDLRSISSDPKNVTVEVRLTCSEGEWTRTEKVHLDPHETRSVSVFFAEPTIGASGTKAHVEIVR